MSANTSTWQAMVWSPMSSQAIIQFYQVVLVMFGALYGILAAFVISRFGVVTQKIVDQYIWYDPAEVASIAKEERARFFWQLHAVIAYPSIFFGHYERIRRLAKVFASEFADPMEYLQVVANWPEKPSVRMKLKVFGLIFLGIALPPMVMVAYYYWLPSLVEAFASVPYQPSLARSFFELAVALLLSALPLGGYVGGIAILERTVTDLSKGPPRYPPRYAHIAKWFWYNVGIWVDSWALALFSERLPNDFGMVLTSVLAIVAVGLTVLLSVHFLLEVDLLHHQMRVEAKQTSAA